MEWVEVTGRTVEEAKEAALDQLGVAESDAEVIVVSDAKTGLFGRLREEARVRARVQPIGPRAKRQRGARDRGRGGQSRGGQSRGGSSEQGSPKEAGERSGAPSGSNGNRSRSGRRRRGGGGTANGSGVRNPREQERRPAGSSSTRESSSEEEKAMAEGMTLEEQGAIARDFLQGLLDQFGFEASVDTRVIDDETIEIAATGADLG